MTPTVDGGPHPGGGARQGQRDGRGVTAAHMHALHDAARASGERIGVDAVLLRSEIKPILPERFPGLTARVAMSALLVEGLELAEAAWAKDRTLATQLAGKEWRPGVTSPESFVEGTTTLLDALVYEQLGGMDGMRAAVASHLLRAAVRAHARRRGPVGDPALLALALRLGGV